MLKQYSVKARVETVMVFILRDRWLDEQDSAAVAGMDSDYKDLVQGFRDGHGVDFSSLQDPRLG